MMKGTKSTGSTISRIRWAPCIVDDMKYDEDSWLAT